MSFKTARVYAAALVLLSVAHECQASSIPYYYNVSGLTLSDGPIELENPTANTPTPFMGGYQVTLSGDAYNDSATQTFDDVLFLDQFAFVIPTGAAFTFNSDIWTAADGDKLNLDSPDGYLSMMDTNAPLTFSQNSIVASVSAGDSPPYTYIGDIGPGQSVPFSFAVDMSVEAPFHLYGSFVSTTPVPEPSTLLLAGLAAIGTFFAARHRRAGK
jgi:hypothetical protein